MDSKPTPSPPHPAERSTTHLVVALATGLVALGAVLADYLAISWFDVGGGEHIAGDFGGLAWYGLPLLGSYWALAAALMLGSPATRPPLRWTPNDARLALPLAVVSFAAWFAFVWFGTNQGVMLN
jgi:hypothetical protein